MNPNHLWNPLPLKEYGDDDPNGLFAAVGMALASWEKLEESLAHLYQQLLGAANHGAQRAYGTVIAFSGRQDMLLAALTEHPLYDREPLNGLDEVISEIGKFSGRRNEIAHGAVHRPTVNGIDRKHYLCAPSYNSRKRLAYRTTLGKENWGDLLTFGSYAYTADQILFYADQFQRLTRSINGFLGPAGDYWRDQKQAQIDFAVEQALANRRD